MKNVWYTMFIILAVGLMSFTGSSLMSPTRCLAAGMGPVLTMGTPLVNMSKNAEVVMMGTGFKPGQALYILITAADGTVSNIGLDVKPELKADGSGTFGCSWKPKRFFSKGLITGGAYKIEVTDTEYKTLAHGVVFFAKKEENKKK